MSGDADEIRRTIAQLVESGEYDRYASARADAEAAFIGRALAQGVELSDEDVDLLVARLTGAEAASDASTCAEVSRAVARSQESLRQQPSAPRTVAPPPNSGWAFNSERYEGRPQRG